MRLLPLVAGTVAILLICLAQLLLMALAPVRRPRLERFARRQGLTITPDNGNAAIRYLATTRRWRVAGLTVGLVASQTYSISRGDLRINSFWLFAGWFVGAVVAEWAITGTRPESRHAALLVPRRRTDYLSRPVRWLIGATTASTLLLGLTAVGRSLTAGRSQFEALALLSTALGVASVIHVVQRQVLTRRQLIGTPDVMAVDDAIRARSLRVLAGSTLALLGYIAVPLLPLVMDRASARGPALAVAWAAPILGWFVAAGHSGVRRVLPFQPAAAVGARP